MKRSSAGNLKIPRTVRSARRSRRPDGEFRDPGLPGIRCNPALLLCLVCMAGSTTVAGPAERQHVLIVVGAAGTVEYGTLFCQWTERWRAAAESGDAEFRLIGLDESGDNRESSDRESVVRILEEWAWVSTTEPLWIVLIGHGTHDGLTTRFNLRGPDITAEEVAELLSGSKRPVALMNCTSCSAPFINAVSGPDRVVITATKDGSEYQFARFGDAVSLAIGSLEADMDQDGQVSLLEAWAFASRRTDEFYESAGRLATEHALLDDNADGRGTRASVFEGVRLQPPSDQDNPDGRIARRWHLVRSEEERRLTAEQRHRRDGLEERLEELKCRREEYSEPEYLDQLETILLPLAQLYASELFSGESGQESGAAD